MRIFSYKILDMLSKQLYFVLFLIVFLESVLQSECTVSSCFASGMILTQFFLSKKFSLDLLQQVKKLVIRHK